MDAWIIENSNTTTTTHAEAMSLLWALKAKGWAITRLSSDGWEATHYWTNRTITACY